MIAIHVLLASLPLPVGLAVFLLAGLVGAGLSAARRPRTFVSALLIACALSFTLHATTSRPTPNLLVPDPCYGPFWWQYIECWIAR